MNLGYLIIPVIVGLVVGVSVFFVQQSNLTGYTISVNTPGNSGDEEISEVLENETECPSSCDDKNPCTTDWCNETSNYICSFIPINGTSDGCWGNPTTCSINSCISGKCKETIIKNCCGNNICESSESCLSCIGDCGECTTAIQSNVINQSTTESSQTAGNTNQSSILTPQANTTNQTDNTTQTNATSNQTTQGLLTHIIISEIQTGPNEFVELYNPTGTDVDTTGWYLSYFSSNRDWNNTYRNWIFPDSTLLKAGKYFLINVFNTAGADWTVLTAEGNPYSSGQISNNGSIALFPFNPRIKTSEEARNSRVDALGWGSPTHVFESSPSPALENSNSLRRSSLNSDTDNNLQDFSLSGSPTPKNSTNQ